MQFCFFVITFCSLTICSIWLIAVNSIFSARIFLNTNIYLIFSVVKICLEIFLTPIFLLYKYNRIINGNVCNTFKIFSVMFRIGLPYLWFFMTSINMFLHVSVYGTYLLFIRFVSIQNIYHITDGCILCWTREFIHWMK